jgi:hypothetical protein
MQTGQSVTEQGIGEYTYGQLRRQCQGFAQHMLFHAVQRMDLKNELGRTGHFVKQGAIDVQGEGARRCGLRGVVGHGGSRRFRSQKGGAHKSVEGGWFGNPELGSTRQRESIGRPRDSL